jgi:hypothetical protein
MGFFSAGAVRDEMEAEETVMGADVLSKVGVTGFEHGGDPGGGDMAVATDAKVINHPEDGFAGFGAA